LVLGVNLSTAKLRANNDQSQLFDVTDASHLPAFDGEATNDGKEVIRESSRDEPDDLVADEFKTLKPSKRSEPSCVEQKVFEWVDCANSNKIVATCRDFSHSACYSAIPIYGVKKCQPIMSWFPGCNEPKITDCECAQ